LLAKTWSDNKDNNYDDNDDNDENVVITSASKNNYNHDVVVFAPFTFAITAADKGVTRPRRRPLTSMPLCRRRGKDPLLSKP
jgi:hypothetical protein